MYHRCLKPLSALLLKARPAYYPLFIPTGVRQLNSGSNLPWFMREQVNSDENTRPALYESSQTEKPTLPEDLPEYLVALHQHLSQSPLLAPSTLRISKPSSFKTRTTTNDLTLPYSRAKGRRRRGVHDAGESVGEPDDMWSWYVLAEVKEGTEGRGAIETVIRNAQREVRNYILPW
jgi:hypothetical protein